MRRLLSASAVLGTAVVLLTSSAAAAHTVVVYAGGPPAFAKTLQTSTGAGLNSFLIKKVVINVGDTVEWNGASLAGGFHTVDIPARHGSDLPIFTPTGTTVSGVKDAAGNPFWFDNGQLPVIGFNPALGPPSGGHTYNGSARIDSGLPTGPPHNFSVKFTNAGTFNYFCDVHYGMKGQVVVKNAHAAIPTAVQDATALLHEEQGYTREAKNVLKTKVPANTVSLGESGPGGLEIFAMFPSNLTIKAGTTVQFAMSQHTRETHTASFGPAPYLTALAKSLQSPVPSPAAIYPSDPPAALTLGPTTHGNGFASTGVLDRDAATATVPAVGAIKFTTPGTYNYICLIHPFMHGTITVK